MKQVDSPVTTIPVCKPRITYITKAEMVEGYVFAEFSDGTSAVYAVEELLGPMAKELLAQLQEKQTENGQ